jgi:branched-chain amino acid transport system permease protein
MYFALATIALMCVFQIVFNNEPTILGIKTGGPDGLRLPMTGLASDMQFPGKTGYYYLAFGLLFVLLLVCDRITHSKMGFYFRSIHANQDAAASLGVNVLRYKLTAHFISAFFTAVGGAVYTTTFLFVSSNIVFGMDISFAMMLFCIVGGANTIWGPIIGALILVPIQQALRIAAGVKLAAFSSLIYGLALCLVILFMPNGILGWIKKLVKKRKISKAGKLQFATEEAEKGSGLDD